MANAMIGYGTIFEVSTDSGSTWDQVEAIYNLTPPGFTRNLVDVTHMQSPDQTSEFIAGIKTPSEMSGEMNFVPGSATASKIDALANLTGNFMARITYRNGQVWTFSGLLMSFEFSAPNDDKMTATFSIQVSGSVVKSVSVAPTNTLLPAISGLLTAGAVLTAYEGVWSGSPIFTYQWKKAGTNISGATSKTYTIVGGDSGAALTVAVTGTNSAGNATATSAAVTAA